MRLLRMNRRRWQILAVIAVWFLASAAAREVVLLQSERTAVGLRPSGVACGRVFLEGAGAPKPVMLKGGFSLEPHGGAIVLQVSQGEVSLEASVSRDGEIVRSWNTTVTSGESIRLKSGWFRFSAEELETPLNGHDTCVWDGAGLPPDLDVSPVGDK